MEGMIHSVQTLGTVDGPGVRCVVFFQGCPLRCACCHNPDTQPFTGGKNVDAVGLAKQLLRYRNYWGPDGGVTASGGEPLAQADFCAELFRELHSHNVHTALDTSGCIINDAVYILLENTDLVLLDHKYGNESDYRRLTGGSLKKTEEFLDICEEMKLPVWLRRVIIPDLNDSVSDTLALKQLSQTYSCVQKTELLPFRRICISKYETLGIPFPLINTPEPSSGLMAELNALLQA